MNKSFVLALAAALSFSTAALAEVPRVVASIKPIHSLVSAVMGELGTPTLLVKGAASPHSYSLTPSDAQALQSADLVFWTGPGLERFLEDSISALAPGAEAIELSESTGIELLAPREAGTFEAHEEESGEGVEHGGGERDMHFFLDPANARIIVDVIATRLAATDPENAGTYRDNAARTTAGLDALIAELNLELAPVRGRPFVVFHDAFQYFERAFDVLAVGSITVSPEVTPGAERIGQIRDKLKTLDAACVFAEPNFNPRLVDVLVEGTSAKAGTLDPEGSTLIEGAGLYRELIGNLASNLRACLGS